METKIIKLKDCAMTAFDYDYSVFGGCPTCNCGCDIEGEFSLSFDNGTTVKFEQTCDDCLAGSGYSEGFISEDDIIKILGDKNVNFSEFTFNNFLEWFTSKFTQTIIERCRRKRGTDVKITISYPNTDDIEINLTIPDNKKEEE